MALLPSGLAKTGVVPFQIYPKAIDQSLRFNDADLPHLFWEPNNTPDGGGQKFTISFWMKRGDFGAQTVYAARTAALAQSYWLIGLTSDRLYIQGGYGANMNLTPNAAHRDPSAWYHVVVAADTTLATANDRVKLYINGEQVTDFSTRTNPSQNADLGVLSTTIDQYIGRQAAQQYFDGYLAEFIIVDNQQLAPTDFGETRSGIWVPKEYSGTYGEGTHLDFADSASIGNDISGNNHDWTVNNLVASDVVPDSPTNNFAVLNNLEQVVNYDFSEGNLRATRVSNIRMTRANFAMPTGKWYWEMYLDGGPTYVWYGVGDQTTDSDGAASVYTGTGYLTRRNSLSNATYDSIFEEGTETTNWGVANVASGDIVMIAYDADAGKIWFGYNGDWEESGDPANGTNEAASWVNQPQTVIPFFSAYAQSHIVNFGQDSTFAGNETAGGNSDANGIGDFAYAPPSGYLALCTANLPDPAIDPAQDATPEDHFNVALYTGASALTVDTGLPSVDMVWIKARGAAYLPRIIDSIRGDDTALYTAAAVAEGSYSVNDDCELNTPTDGNLYFDVTNAGTNGSGVSTVAWAWKAGGTSVLNEDGSIDSQVSANTDAGFSIVSYVGNATAGATVGHGLNSAPEMIIVKNRDDGATHWHVYHQDVGNTKYLLLSLINAATTASNRWNDTSPSSSVVTLGNHVTVNGSSDSIIAYCFHSVDQYSKVGSYIGNGSTDGVFVYTGFKPKWIMVKRSDSGVATADWYIWDAERNTFNVAGKTVQANESTAESDSGNHDLDILSNGFKLRIDYATVNGSGNTHIYLAFAEQPVKYSNAR